MADVLIHGDTMRSPELRHEVPVPIPDAFLYAEKGGRRVAILHSLEIPRVRQDAPGLEIIPLEQLGIDELLAQGKPYWQTELEIAVRACREMGMERPAVPPGFPVAHADYLRANGIEVVVERELFDNRRRSKNETEIAGIRRAQRACEAALDASRELLRTAEPNGGGLELDGEPLTCERIKRAIEDVFADHGVEGSDMIVSHGAQTAVGHDMGSGQIAPNEPIVFDLFPRDKETGCYADMTRTYVVGEPSDEMKEWYRLVKGALETSTAGVKPGVNGRTCSSASATFSRGGLQDAAEQGARRGARGRLLPRARPRRRPRGARAAVAWAAPARDLVPGDVITIEPGLYRSGYGGLRLEDIVLVTDDGARGPHGLPVRPRAVTTHTIETMLLEERRYPPPTRSSPARRTRSRRSTSATSKSSGRRRGVSALRGSSRSRLYEWEPPYAKWYLGGKLNIYFNCVDRHVEAGNGDKVAYYWEGEPEDERRDITFADLQREVVRFANALKELGVGKGTPVGIYMGMVPERRRDARLRAARRAAHGGLRRLLR